MRKIYCLPRQSEKQNNQKSVNSVRKLGFIKSFLRVMALFYSILKCVILLLSTLSLKAKHLHLVLNITDPRHQLNSAASIAATKYSEATAENSFQFIQ